MCGDLAGWNAVNGMPKSMILDIRGSRAVGRLRIERDRAGEA